MTSPKNPLSAALIALLEVLLVFVVGIMGDKISESLQLPPIAVGLITILCLLILSAVSYSRNHDVAASPIKQLSFGITISRFIPKTVIGIIPFGLTIGLIIGMVAILSLGGQTVSIFSLYMLSFDFYGILCGLGICLFFGIIFDGPLAGGLALGYGLSYATSALLLQPIDHFYYSPLYYLAYIVGFVLFAIVLAVSEPKFMVIRRTITEPRL